MYLKAEKSLDAQNYGGMHQKVQASCVDGQSQETLLACFENTLCLLAIF
jgi:hypothetical protein